MRSNKKKPNTYKEILTLLRQLKEQYPTYGIGRHFSTAFSDYPDLWSLPDSEILFALTKYKSELDIDSPPKQEDIDKIISDGLDLEHILDEDEDDY